MKAVYVEPETCKHKRESENVCVLYCIIYEWNGARVAAVLGGKNENGLFRDHRRDVELTHFTCQNSYSIDLYQAMR